ncbi:MAG: GTPase HflX [Planctomycetota bacterium]|nr:GTPase HflX [Planctomycetota bacterium]
MEQGLRSDVTLQKETAILVAVHMHGDDFDAEDPFGELRALAESAGVRVVATLEQNRRNPSGRSYVGKGKLEELAILVVETGAKVIVFDNELAPSQIQVLEEATKCKVLDRSELILDIFANRATTRAAILQVEIAQLEYVAPRLRAMWTHLGQVTGGAPMGVGTRGPGEQQIEIDRRIVKRRLTVLRNEMNEVLERRAREVSERRRDHFTACLVGYTNAGKSSLFNALTAGGAFANDQLFATLATRVEVWNTGGGESVMLGDTVGFIRNLPHHLVASFRATLEDAISAHVLLVVVDAADRNARMHWKTVCEVLDSIGASTQPRVLILNKVDQLQESTRSELVEQWKGCGIAQIAVSALTKEGIGHLSETVRVMRTGQATELDVWIPMSQSKAIDFIERRTEVLDRHWDGDRVRLRIRAGRGTLDQVVEGGVPIEIDGLKGKAGLDKVFGVTESWGEARRTPPHERINGGD